MVSRVAWLTAGLDVLADEGVTNLRIDRLASVLGLSKGSFYHHFAGISSFRLDLLDYYESRCTNRYIEVVEAEAHITAWEKFERLREVVFADDQWGPELDVAVRAWASQDDDARVMQERVDATRMGYLRALWIEMTGDSAEADDISTMIYLLLVGAYHVSPPVPTSALNRLYDRVLRTAAEGGVS